MKGEKNSFSILASSNTNFFFVKNFVFNFTSMQNELFSHVHFLIFDFCERRKKFISHNRELKYNFFFTNSKLRVRYTCVLNFISIAWVERIKISNCLSNFYLTKVFCKIFWFSLVHSKLEIFFYHL